MKRVRLALLWHMHQPLYREPETGEGLMPWVRLHATRAYNDMAWILVQLDDYAAGRARDRFLDLTLRPAADLAPEERQAILRSVFMGDRATTIQPPQRHRALR